MKLEYIDEGKGEVIVFVHSYLWDKEMWRPQVEHLKEKHRCISIDLPGHGDSSNLENIGSNEVISSISLAISELLSNLNISSYTYIGLSIGGMLAIPLYRIDKKKIKKMIIMDSYLGEEKKVTKISYSNILAQVEKNKKISSRVAEEIVPLFFSKQLLNIKHDLYRKFFSKLINIEESRIETIVKIGKAINNRKNFLEELKTVEVPMVFIAGEYDIPRPFSESEEMFNLKKDSLLFKIKDAGHISNLENIVDVNSILDKIL